MQQGNKTNKCATTDGHVDQQLEDDDGQKNSKRSDKCPEGKQFYMVIFTSTTGYSIVNLFLASI